MQDLSGRQVRSRRTGGNGEIHERTPLLRGEGVEPCPAFERQSEVDGTEGLQLRGILVARVLPIRGPSRSEVHSEI